MAKIKSTHENAAKKTAAGQLYIKNKVMIQKSKEKMGFTRKRVLRRILKEQRGASFIYKDRTKV